MDKNTLRKQIQTARDSLSETEIDYLSGIISEKIINLKEFQDASSILSYASFRSEVKTQKIIEYALKNGKTVGVPKVNGDWMDFYLIRSVSELEPGYFGVPEPSACADRIIDPEGSFVLVPGLVFDENMNRIGYGKGYYDRYFRENQMKNFIKCGMAFDIQFVEKIETDPHDIALDMVVTESHIIRSF